MLASISTSIAAGTCSGSDETGFELDSLAAMSRPHANHQVVPDGQHGGRQRLFYGAGGERSGERALALKPPAILFGHPRSNAAMSLSTRQRDTRALSRVGFGSRPRFTSL